MGRATNTGWAEARLELDALEKRLREAGGGAVIDAAAAKVSRQINAISSRFHVAHKRSGDAAAAAFVTVSGGLIQYEQGTRYAKFIPGNPYRNDKSFPPVTVAYATKVFAAELDAAVSGKPSPIAQEAAAEAAKEEAAAERSRAKFKAETARIYRRSAEGKAKRKAERAYDRATKAREDRE